MTIPHHQQDPPDQSAGHVFIRPGQIAPGRPARDACMQCGEPLTVHALQAVLEALDMPHPATVGDGEVHDRILQARVMNTVVFLRGLLDEGRATPPEWGLEYFREKLAEQPATGYRTWDEAVAETRARQEVQQASRGSEPSTDSLADSEGLRQLSAYLDQVDGPEAEQ
jgi:hypothetical protein